MSGDRLRSRLLVHHGVLAEVALVVLTGIIGEIVRVGGGLLRLVDWVLDLLEGTVAQASDIAAVSTRG